jgi:uncharacterized protein YrrD
MSDIQDLDVLIGRSVLSLDSANKLGEVYDIVVHPTAGDLIGLCVQIPDQSLLLVEQEEIHSIGPDAVMVQSDHSLEPVDQSPLKSLPLAKNGLIGVEVVTEDGKSLGEIANIYFHLENTSGFFIYEVRSSILDKILGHSLYFPASFGRAFADDGTRLVVSNDTENADRKLDAVVARLFPPPSANVMPEISVRSYGR